MTDDELMKAFRDAGYTYPGTPAAGVRLLLSEVSRLQVGADADRKRYAELLAELDAALEASPLHETPADPVKHVARLCKLTKKDGTGAIENAVRTLRARHPGDSAAFPQDDEFLYALDELTEVSRDAMAPVVAASVAYWRALQEPASSDHALVAAVLARWLATVAAYPGAEM